MRTVADPEVVRSLKVRLEMLRPDSARRWGTMTPQEMLCHLGDAAAMVLLTRDIGSPQSFFRLANGFSWSIRRTGT